MTQDALKRWLDGIEATLREAWNPSRAVGEKAYLKSDLEFIGTGVLRGIPFLRS